ncbi:hypothetical protein LCGC14_1778330 [marine sediment metagenome]|uniref:Uncharacterized protein n=2 Tax=marine sediment metagenome TaxID=412755 RepID=A0A0F9JVT3_9ZZZZ
MSPIVNSGSPLSGGEELFRECELGLDAEVVDYMRESHTLQIRVGGEPFYIFQRVEQGEFRSKSITSWETTASQYSAYIWQPTDGEDTHPNSRTQKNTFKIFNDAVELTRVFDKDSIAYDTEYAIEVETGIDVDTVGAVLIWFNEEFIPGNVSYSYRNICSCVDRSTGYPNRECPICRGTSYPAAFTQYLTSATKYNPVNTVLVRVPMAAEDVPVEQIGRVTRRDLMHWIAYNAPYVNNYDLIIGTMGRNTGVVWEIVNKSDSRWRGILMHQEFGTVRIEDSDIRYQLAPDAVKPVFTETVTVTSDAEIVYGTAFTSDAEITV